jgi:hypothetical protein
VIPNEFILKVMDNRVFLESMLRWITENDSAKTSKNPALSGGFDELKAIIQ